MGLLMLGSVRRVGKLLGAVKLLRVFAIERLVSRM